MEIVPADLELKMEQVPADMELRMEQVPADMEQKMEMEHQGLRMAQSDQAGEMHLTIKMIPTTTQPASMEAGETILKLQSTDIPA